MVLHGDCLELLRALPDNSVDSIVTDPPYGLGKEPDALAMLIDWMTLDHHDVKGRGFMGKEWDAFVPQPAIWRECLRVLKPGGHILAFAGTRTQDLMALGLRVAGFEIRDMIAWAYGSGFPKSLDVSKAIDAAAGAEREVVGQATDRREDGTVYGVGHSGAIRSGQAVTAAAAAAGWQGWGTALKPALEPITVARKPLQGTVAANVLAHGTGAINVDACRVPFAGESDEKESKSKNQHGESVRTNTVFGVDKSARGDYDAAGRWPANLIHDGSDCGLGDAQRFFYCAKASKADRNYGCQYLPDTSAAEMVERTEGSAGINSPRAGAGRTGGGRNTHPTVKPIALMRYLCRLVTPPHGTVLDPFTGSGTTGVAAVLEGFDFIGMERDASSVAIADERILQALIDVATIDLVVNNESN